MKRFLAIFSLALLNIALIPLKTFADDETGYFIVTAYYSPLPDQKYYYTGNYESEIRLEGRGTNGASGKEVFAGMLAAPKTYEFGTKIYLEGLGIGDVQDRGGAIVSAGNRGNSYDRIDVWMGYGEEGLKRALYWGKRTIKGYIVHSSQPTTLDYSGIAAPDWVLNEVKKVNNEDFGYLKDSETSSEGQILELSKEIFENVEEIDLSVFEYSLAKGSDSQKVENLQVILQEMGFYSGEISGKYTDVMNVIFDFQVEKGILKSEYDVGAGAFGPKTREIFKGEYLSFLEKKTIEEKLRQEEEKKRLEQEKKMEELKAKFVEMQVSAISKSEKELKYLEGVEFGESSQRVRDFQLFLKKLGYFDEKDTAIFGEKTKTALLNFQADNGVISSKEDKEAGIVGPRTIEAFVSVLSKEYVKEELEKMPELKELN